MELVRLHGSDMEPVHTAAWLRPRPQLHRHHHVRLANDKVQPRARPAPPATRTTARRAAGLGPVPW